jgi:hypothetical protein
VSEPTIEETLAELERAESAGDADGMTALLVEHGGAILAELRRLQVENARLKAHIDAERAETHQKLQEGGSDV